MLPDPATIYRCAYCGDDGGPEWETGRECPRGCADDFGCVERNIPASEDGPERDVMIVCPDCGGSATLNCCPDCLETCPACRGEGQVEIGPTNRLVGRGAPEYREAECGLCGGRGKVVPAVAEEWEAR